MEGVEESLCSDAPRKTWFVVCGFAVVSMSLFVVAVSFRLLLQQKEVGAIKSTAYHRGSELLLLMLMVLLGYLCSFSRIVLALLEKLIPGRLFFGKGFLERGYCSCTAGKTNPWQALFGKVFLERTLLE